MGLALLVLGAGTTAEAAKRGHANTATRAVWCADRLESCKEGGEKDCADRYEGNTGGELQCNSDVWQHCNRQWGNTSDCLTREKPAPGVEIQAPATSGELAPPSRTNPTKPRATPGRMEQ
jgi:hypothetical protein